MSRLQPTSEREGREDRLESPLAWYIILCALFVVVWLGMPYGTYYSPDEGGKYLQMRGMENGPLHPVRLIYPGNRKDSARVYYPARIEFAIWSTHAYPSVNADGRVQPNWPPWFPWISKPFFAWLGHRGLTLVPLLCGLLAAWLAGALAERLVAGARRLALAAFALASPVLFYSLTFWEHTLALVFQLAAVLCAWPQPAKVTGGRSIALIRMMVAGAFLLGAVALRRESLFLVGAIGILLVLRNREKWSRGFMHGKMSFIAGVLAAIAALAAMHSGLLPERTAADFTSTLHRAANWKTWANLGPHFFDVFFLRNWGSLLPTALRWAGRAGLVLCLVNAFWPRSRRPAVFAAGFLLILPAALFMAFTPIRYRALSSLVLSAPFVLFSLLPGPAGKSHSPSRHFIVSLALLYALFFFFGTWPSCRGHGAPEWGTRYALVLFAMLSAIGAANVVCWLGSPAVLGWRKPAMAGLVAVALFVGAASLVRGVRELRTTRNDLGRIQAALASSTAPIVTDCWWIGVGMPDLFMQREIYAIASPDELCGWLDTVGKDESSFVYASYELLPATVRLREKDRMEPVAHEAICGMEIDTYRILPASERMRP